MPEFDPIQELSQIKNQLNSLKDKISAKAPQTEIDRSFSDISANLNKIIAIFQHAADEMEKAPPEDAEKLKGMIEEIEEENKSIAKGIVVLAEMIKERLPEKPKAQIPPRAAPAITPQIRPIPTMKIIQPEISKPFAAQPKPAASSLPPVTPSFAPQSITPATAPPPLRPSPTPMPPLRREIPSLEEMPPPPRPPPEMLGFPQPRKLPEEKPEKGGLFGKIFPKK